MCGGVVGVDVSPASPLKELQVGSDFQEQADTVNLFQGQQSHSKAKRGTNEGEQKRVFGSRLVALEAPGGLPEHKGLIHGLCSTTARFFGPSSSASNPLSSQVCDEYKVK